MNERCDQVGGDRRVVLAFLGRQDLNRVNRRFDGYAFPGVERKNDRCLAGAGGVVDPNRVMEVDGSASPQDFPFLVKQWIGRLGGRQVYLRDGLGVFGDGVFVVEHRKRAGPDARRADHQDQIACAADA